MKINDFKLECFFSKYEFTAPYLLTQSDCESMSVGDLLKMEPGSEEKLMNLWLGYTETWGDPELRKMIATLYEDIIDENVLVMHGASEGIFALLNVLLNDGDHMIALYPNYQSLYEVANSIPDCTFSKWLLKDDGEKWVVDFDELEALIQPNTKLITVTTPNNPTGYTFTNAEMKRLAAIAEQHNLTIISDEVYRGLELDGEKRPAMADLSDKAISIGVMSKAYGLPGLRVGWIVSKDLDVLERTVKFKHYMSICDAAPSELLAKVALKHGDEILGRNIEILKSNLKLADAFFLKYKDLFSQRVATAGPIALHRLDIDMPVEEFCEEAVEKKGVLLMPATMYDMEGNYFRMGYGRVDFAENIGKFEDFLLENNYV